MTWAATTKLAVRHAGRRATAGSRALPDYVIIGAQRCGTSSLQRWLRPHPQVLLAPAVREVHWFDAHPERDLRWYRSHFPRRAAIDARAARLGAPVITGEKTPAYLLHPGAPAAAAAVLGDARFIVLLRDPVQRAISHYFMNLRYGVEPLSLSDAIAQESDRCDATFQAVAEGRAAVLGPAATWAYVRRGRYLEQLEAWWRHVDRDRFLFVRAEDLFGDPAGTYAQVCRFLGIDETWAPSFGNDSRGANRQEVDASDIAALAALLDAPSAALAAATGIAWP